ncbi:MAG: co-chaperone YbbN [Actinomycetia bacterium]|nr:co-chaperone YbbN [Actinomycetes bacterium]MCP4226733.1 co-chaperone YbbN [Actinomycetes bacterium]MCP5031216.1 co-chaperone YbbN [Actinomycetes bacterium]
MMIDVTDASFETDILQRSMTTPVVVDLWAPWCEPCKTLGPIIEKVVDDTNGRVVLAKINVDENPQASAAFRVQSIPAVFAMSDGQVVDGFVGAQPEAKIREFVNGLIAGEMEAELTALVVAGDEASLRRALEIDATHQPAALALAQLLIDQGHPQAAAEVLEPFADDEGAAALLEKARSGALPPADRSRIEDRLAALLDSVKADDEARQEFVGLLDELTAGDPPSAAEWRKKLSARLF